MRFPLTAIGAIRIHPGTGATLAPIHGIGTADGIPTGHGVRAGAGVMDGTTDGGTLFRAARTARQATSVPDSRSVRQVASAPLTVRHPVLRRVTTGLIAPEVRHQAIVRAEAQSETVAVQFEKTIRECARTTIRIARIRTLTIIPTATPTVHRSATTSMARPIAVQARLAVIAAEAPVRWEEAHVAEEEAAADTDPTYSTYRTISPRKLKLLH